MKIFGGRASLVGDQIMALPLINILRKMYGLNIDLTWPISKKCRQASPLYIDQPGISSIYITNEEENLNSFELQLINENFDLFINPTPQHPLQQDWYNYRSCVEETILMMGQQYHEIWKTLPKETQKPRLKKWREGNVINDKYIAIHPVAGYGAGANRSPSREWWLELGIKLNNLGYNIIQLGHPKDFYFVGCEKDYRDLSLFEQVQIAARCQWYIGTDSGFSWIMNALGANCISLITNWLPNHNKNLLALAPDNWANRNHNLFGSSNCDAINQEEVLEILCK